MEFFPTSKSASEFNQTQRLAEWVQTFLHGEGNNLKLAGTLMTESATLLPPVQIPIELCQRCCGPEPGMQFLEDRELFERRVIRLYERLESGWDMPPLIARLQDDELVLNDGNHRHEAARRFRWKTCPVIVWASDADSVERLYRSRFAPFFES